MKTFRGRERYTEVIEVGFLDEEFTNKIWEVFREMAMVFKKQIEQELEEARKKGAIEAAKEKSKKDLRKALKESQPEVVINFIIDSSTLTPEEINDIKRSLNK